MSNPEKPNLDNLQVPRKEKPKSDDNPPRYYISDYEYMTTDTLITYRDDNGVEITSRLGDFINKAGVFMSKSDIHYSHGF